MWRWFPSKRGIEDVFNGIIVIVVIESARCNLKHFTIFGNAGNLLKNTARDLIDVSDLEILQLEIKT